MDQPDEKVMLQQIALGVYYPGDSLLHRLQARTKLLVLFWLTVALTIANQREWHFAPYAVAVALVCASVGISGIGPGAVWRRMRLLVLLSLVGGIVLLPFGVGKPLYTLGPLVITYDSVWLLMSVFTVLLVLYTLALLLTMTTTPVGLIEGLTLLLAPLRRLRLPVDEFALMALIALRFIPTLVEETEQLIKAQTARGADFKCGPLGDRLQSLVMLLVPLVQGAWRRAGELATALESRGYTLEGRQTLLHETALGPADYAALGVVVLAMAGALLP
jgi:energy-coupling factor transport system permease protein